MKRYIIDWDFSSKGNSEYAAKSTAATELCETQMQGIRVSKSTWMVEYDEGIEKLTRKFLADVYADGRKVVRPSRDESGLHGDHINICQIEKSRHSDRASLDAWFDPVEKLLREYGV